MLEIAGGILIAIAVLVLVLAYFGWILLGLSVLFAMGLVAGGVAVLVALPSDGRNAILIMAGVVVAVAAFGYWTHHDKRFLLPDDRPPPGKDK
jgi:hypothetical protein